MRITDIYCAYVAIPIEKPIQTAIHTINNVGAVLIRLQTDQGIHGESYVFSLNGRWLKVYDSIIRELRPHYIDQNPFAVSSIWQDIWASLNPVGQSGLAISVLSALDVACWDIVGKATEQPLANIFGGGKNLVPTYASGGLWLKQSTKELCSEAENFLNQGFTGMKMRISGKHENLKQTITRVEAVRGAIGPQYTLYVDANQSGTRETAVMLADALRPYNVAWLEEPVDVHDLEGQSVVTQKSRIPIAAGETVYGTAGIRALKNANACDVYMPDLQRIGGYTEMKRACAVVAPQPVSTHLFTEHSLCVAAAMPNCVSVEHMPWFQPIMNEALDLINGELVVPQRPGHGFSFDPRAVDHFAIG
ncbi:MAG: mandelate racemase/muconate lactonizing enzyme family protein [Alphaproteobacteria bacterium]|nr:mandelate racemase/muconate lactonizing enzyme family protein [Alphaproteobacteria bacterium]